MQIRLPSPIVTNNQRLAITSQCRDCDDIPKAEDAGLVIINDDNIAVQIMHNGLQVVADGYIGAWMTCLIQALRGHHEPQEERLFHEVLKTFCGKSSMIELGGWWSYYSLWFLKDNPQRRAIVVEADPNHLEVGKINAKLNKLTPTFLNAIVGGSSSDSVQIQLDDGKVITLPKFSIEQIMIDQGLDHLDILHCDIDGAEVDTLLGCMNIFKERKVNWVFVSTHSHHVSKDPLTHLKCLDILRKAGAIIEHAFDVHEGYSGDGLIVARFCARPKHYMPPHISINRSSRGIFRDVAFDLNEVAAERNLYQATLKKFHLDPPVSESIEVAGSMLCIEQECPLGDVGETILLPADDVISPEVKRIASWEIAAVMDFALHVRDDMEPTLVDIGANIGLFSRQFLKLVPSVESIIAVEPDFNNFCALEFNLKKWNEILSLHNIALGANNENKPLYRDSRNIGNYSLIAEAVENSEHERRMVDVYHAGDWLSENTKNSKSIVLKLDTQGMDEIIVSSIPIEKWDCIQVAMIELWRIGGKIFDQNEFAKRISSFPHRKLGNDDTISVDGVLKFLDGCDRNFSDLLLWR